MVSRTFRRKFGDTPDERSRASIEEHSSEPSIAWVFRRATLCDMRTVTHREMRNESGEILRHVANGETIQVTNHGQVAALIVPPSNDTLAELISRGQVRLATRPLSSLGSVLRRKPGTGSKAIVDDARGCW